MLAAAPAAAHDGDMRKLLTPLVAGVSGIVVSLAVCAASAPVEEAPPAVVTTPVYAGDKLVYPADYRQWIYLTTGFDMSYTFSLAKMGHHMMDNVFVNPQAWAAFQKTGTWPDKTIIVIEPRGVMDKGSINKEGHYQSQDVMGLEVHVKDEARFPGGKWAFFTFDDPARPSTMIPTDTDCYTCHAKHGAVDNTFVQFYPTLMPIASAKGTLSQAYVDEEKAKK